MPGRRSFACAKCTVDCLVLSGALRHARVFSLAIYGPWWLDSTGLLADWMVANPDSWVAALVYVGGWVDGPGGLSCVTFCCVRKMAEIDRVGQVSHLVVYE